MMQHCTQHQLCDGIYAMRQLTERQQKILSIFLESPGTERSVSDFTGLDLDRTTIFRDLKKMSIAGIIRLEGKSYHLNATSDAYIEWDLTRPPHQRESVRYNPDFLGQYKPNETFLLTDRQLRLLEETGRVTVIKKADIQDKPYSQVLNSLLIDLTYASSNLENVNVSWLDTKTLIEFGERPNGLSEKQLRLVLNHKEAIAFLTEHRENLSVNQKDIMDIHTLLTSGLIADHSAIGTLRTRVVKFDDSKYLPPDNPHQLRDAFDEFCEKVNEIKNLYEQAFFSMIFIPYIQPFQDGNKRTSRLVMNIPLIKNEVSPFSFSDIRRRDYTFGLLAFYERGKHNFLAESFTESYGRSAQRYTELISHINDGGILNTIEGDSEARSKIQRVRM